MKAVILFSGGLDSTVMLALALSQGKKCLALSFDYGQKHLVELEKAKEIAAYYQVPHKIIKIDKNAFGQTPLCCSELKVKNRTKKEILSSEISPYYVPARNTIFLSFALAQAEILSADEIWHGSNADDRSFPDCSKKFHQAFEALAGFAINGKTPKVIAPLIDLNKSAIIQLAKSLNAPIEMTHSCYDPIDGKECGVCDACMLRPTYENRD